LVSRKHREIEIVRLYRLLPVLTLVGALLAALPAEAARLQDWQFDTEENRLTFTTDDSVEPTAQLLSNPTRLVIDIPGTTPVDAQTQSYEGAIKEVRVSELNDENTRLVVEYNSGFSVDPNQVQVRGENARQWTVQLPEATEMNSPRANRDRLSSSVRRRSPMSAQQPSQPSEPSSASSNRELPTLPNGQFTVVIDPGHGGRDPGAIGINGIQEKQVVIDISSQVAALLREQGANVVMTRDRDIEVELEPRVQIAENADASVFVSIHANAISMSRPDVNGLETFYSSEAGHRLANTVQNTVLSEMEMNDRGVRSARFYVIRQTSMPAILIETGFLTGAEDSPKLADPAWRTQMATVIAKGILLHLQNGL
jgi:N-acetylmuramoyl-L-alanine amidase